MKLFRRASIRTQLTVVLLAMSALPLLTLFFTNRTYVQAQLFDRARATYASALTQTGSYLSDKAVLARNLLNMLFADPHIQQGYDFFKSGFSNDETAWLADLSSGRVTYKGSLLGSLSRVYYYQGQSAESFRADSLYAMLDANQRDGFETWLADRSRNTCFLTFTEAQLGSPPRYVYLLAKVPSATRLGVTIGLMQAELSTAALSDILASANAGSSFALYLINSGGQAFLTAGSTVFDSDALSRFCAALRYEDQDGGALNPLSFDGASYLAGQTPIVGTDWRLVMAVPTRSVTAIARGADRALLVTTLALLLVTLPAAALIAHNIIRPIDRLQDGVNAISRGDYSVEVPLSGTPELDQVIDSFNDMRRKTRRMMDEQYRMGQDLKGKELQLLQEQINPHFLYNTIDLLHWQARKAGSSEMAETTQALSRFYKLSLGHGEEFVTLEHELDHVAAYMRIQNIRFMNRIRLSIDVPEELRGVRIVKMILQPLVENSIQHGIREKPDETGLIEISARRQGDHVRITVADDGVGMDQATVERIVSSDQPGYGVYNVNDRLVLHYGSGAGLVFDSVPGEGTRASFQVPFD